MSEIDKQPSASTNASSSTTTLPWYALYGRYANVEVVNELQRAKDATCDYHLHDFFVPIETKNVKVAGKIVKKKQLFTGHYIFLKGKKEDIVKLKHDPSITTDIRFLHPRIGSTALITVPDNEMLSFRNAILAMNQEVEYFTPTREELESGDRIRIIGGPFDGVEGILEHKKGHDCRRIIVAVSSMLAIRTLDIEPEHIQLLDFARERAPKAITASLKSGTAPTQAYKSRAYKQIKSLLTESRLILQQYQKQGILSPEDYLSTTLLHRRYSALKLTGKLKEQHQEAINNLKTALEL